MAQSSADIKLTQSVINQLAMQGIRTPCKVTVTVDKGLATLSGTVTQAHMKMAATSIASGTSGVKRVVNQLVVKATERGNKTSGVGFRPAKED
jgi:osmotically-inducible protein OsmY